MEGYGFAKSTVFYLEDIPALYLPWGVFPIRKERQTGFLFPDGGYSSTAGLRVNTAFFWAISKQMDATFFLDYWGDRGFKEGLQYRYALTEETHGQARFYFIDDHKFDGNRYALFIQNEQRLPYDSYLKGDINCVSDCIYFRDFSMKISQSRGRGRRPM